MREEKEFAGFKPLTFGHVLVSALPWTFKPSGVRIEGDRIVVTNEEVLADKIKNTVVLLEIKQDLPIGGFAPLTRRDGEVKEVLGIGSGKRGGKTVGEVLATIAEKVKENLDDLKAPQDALSIAYSSHYYKGGRSFLETQSSKGSGRALVPKVSVLANLLAVVGLVIGYMGKTQGRDGKTPTLIYGFPVNVGDAVRVYRRLKGFVSTIARFPNYRIGAGVSTVVAATEAVLHSTYLRERGQQGILLYFFRKGNERIDMLSRYDLEVRRSMKEARRIASIEPILSALLRDNVLKKLSQQEKNCLSSILAGLEQLALGHGGGYDYYTILRHVKLLLDSARKDPDKRELTGALLKSIRESLRISGTLWIAGER